jgi:hypothetical protein
LTRFVLKIGVSLQMADPYRSDGRDAATTPQLRGERVIEQREVSGLETAE